MQLKEKDKSLALTFRECGWTQARVAEDLGVNVRTIQRFEERSKKLKRVRYHRGKLGQGQGEPMDQSKSEPLTKPLMKILD